MKLKTNVEQRRGRKNFMKEKVLKELLEENDLIMLDTCFAMRDEFGQFIDNIEMELMVSKKKIIVKSVVMAELCRHMESPNQELSSKATKAINIICMRRNIFCIHEERKNSDVKTFADIEFITDFAESRIKYRMALLTNDYKLGTDILRLNNLKSCHGKKIEVFSLNHLGYLEKRVYINIHDAKEIKEETMNTEVEKSVSAESKMDWMTIFLSSATSFVLGVAIDKYGKRILNFMARTFV